MRLSPQRCKYQSQHCTLHGPTTGTASCPSGTQGKASVAVRVLPFDQEMMNCTTTVERQEVTANKLKHLDEIAADRKVDVRGNTVSERGARRPEPDGAGQLINMCMDGMGQAKFRCPRNSRITSKLSSLWRPQLHVLGAISWGHIEAYFIMSPDTKKGCQYGVHRSSLHARPGRQEEWQG